MTMMSVFNACRFSAVSFNVSPFTRLDAVVAILITSAESRFAASSKLVRVRVDGSMNRFTIVLPRSDGTFLTARSPTCLNAVAVSSTSVISSAVRLLNAQQVFVVPRGRRHRSITTSSLPSISTRRTCTRSCGAVGTFLPT